MGFNIEAEAKKLLLNNRRESDGFQYTVPSVEHYPYQWLWDSCFHAIILAQFEPEAAKKELTSLMARQFDSGMVPHIIYWTPGILHLFRWGVEGTSALTQPPMIAYAAWETHRAAQDRAWLEEIYPKLLKFYQFLLTERDPHEHHLAGIINPDESGEDNSPRFDAVLGAPKDINYADHLKLREKLVDEHREDNFNIALDRRYFWVKDVLFNAMLVENLRCLGHIASLLKHEDGEHFANTNAELVANAMRERMFVNGTFWATSGQEYTKLTVATWNHFVPLFAGLYTEEEARHLVDHELTNPETFRGAFGIRTVSKKEPSYHGEGYTDGFSWRGPSWISSHWFIYRGLVRYGYLDEAQEIRRMSEQLIQMNGFRECFDPETGEGLGAHGFTWGALILDMKTEPATISRGNANNPGVK